MKLSLAVRVASGEGCCNRAWEKGGVGSVEIAGAVAQMSCCTGRQDVALGLRLNLASRTLVQERQDKNANAIMLCSNPSVCLTSPLTSPHIPSSLA